MGWPVVLPKWLACYPVNHQHRLVLPNYLSGRTYLSRCRSVRLSTGAKSAAEIQSAVEESLVGELQGAILTHYPGRQDDPKTTYRRRIDSHAGSGEDTDLSMFQISMASNDRALSSLAVTDVSTNGGQARGDTTSQSNQSAWQFGASLYRGVAGEVETFCPKTT